MTAALGSSAFRLALHGYAVFPLAVGSKVPMPGSHGFLEANSDADVARARWNKWPSANIGVATGPASDFWALDIDAPKGIDTMKALVRTISPRSGRSTKRSGAGSTLYPSPSRYRPSNATRNSLTS